MGFDIGGGSARCLLLDLERGRTFQARRAWSRASGGAGGSELDLDEVFAGLAEAARDVQAKAGRPEVVGVAAAGMRFGTVVLAGDGRVLLATTNRDARAAGEAMAWAAEEGPAWQARTGHWPAPVLTGARLRWMREQAPGVLAEAAHVLALNDWLAWRLSGEAATDASQAGVTGLFDLAAGAWVSGLGDLAGLLPEVRPAGSVVGALAADAAEALALPAGVAVAVGGGDTQCGLLGMGVLSAGQVGAVCGTTMPLQQVTAAPAHDASGRLWIEPHVVPGTFVAESNAGPTGDALAWLGATLFPDAPDPAARLLAEAGLATPGAHGMLSTFGAEVMDARAMAFPIGDLTLSHLLGEASQARAGLARSVVEGMAYAARANLEQISAAAGTATGPLAVGGGMTRSRLWPETLADVLERPVAVAEEPEATALGAALCAAVGAGAAADLREAAGRWVTTREVVPDAERGATVRAAWPRWQELRASRAAAAPIVQGHAIQTFLAGLGPAADATARSERPRILVTADLDPDALALLRGLGEVEYASFREVGRLLTGATLVEALQGFQVFVTEIDLVDGGSLLELPDLRVVATCRGDAVNVDVEACTACGIPVLHAPGRNADAVADLALAFMLGLSRKLPEASMFLRDPALEPGDMGGMGRAFGTLRGRELWGKTVGLVGLGAVGRKVAHRVRPFGARVLVFDPWIPAEAVALAGAEAVGFDELLARSDIVSLHAAVTEESEDLIGAQALARMKPGALLVNTARAALVDEEALAEALASGHLGGAGLDVFSVEPPGADHPLLLAPNVIATPHVGGNTFEIGAHQGAIVGADLARLLGSGAPRHVLNREVLAGFSLGRERPRFDDATRRRLLERPPPAVTDLQKNKKKKPGSGRKITKKASSTSATGQPPSGPTVPAEARDAMRRLLEAFTADFAADADIAAFAAGKEVVLHFRLTDFDLDFWLGLRDGQGEGAVGAPAEEPPVQLEMRAATLDGMLAGTVNATQEAMRGGISFSGDAGKAMTIQQLQADLQRIYLATRERVGAPGDLDAW